MTSLILDAMLEDVLVELMRACSRVSRQTEPLLSITICMDLMGKERDEGRVRPTSVGTIKRNVGLWSHVEEEEEGVDWEQIHDPSPVPTPSPTTRTLQQGFRDEEAEARMRH
jgi:hypothetical protein